MKVVLGRKIILFGKTLTKEERKEKEKEKRLGKEIFVTYVGMEVKNVGNVRQLSFRSEYSSLKNKKKEN